MRSSYRLALAGADSRDPFSSDGEVDYLGAVGRDIAGMRIAYSPDLDVFPVATDLGEQVAGTCYSFQPERMSKALRMMGSSRDFSDDPDALFS